MVAVSLSVLVRHAKPPAPQAGDDVCQNAKSICWTSFREIGPLKSGRRPIWALSLTCC